MTWLCDLIVIITQNKRECVRAAVCDVDSILPVTQVVEFGNQS